MRAIVATLVVMAIAAVAVHAASDTAWQKTLPEVTVRLKPIEQSRDTVKYNVAAFTGKDDHYLEDVLKKLPGVEVAENGTITYKGNAINQFTIEGQNLLGNRYNQATRNLPVEAVAQVQVMENDQPIRALKRIRPSDRATLNVKLKHGYKIRPFGELQAGLGGFGNLLWNNHANLIDISSRNQMLVTAKMNNNGENLDDNTLDHVDIADYENYVPLPSEIVGSRTVTSLPILEKRYLQNKSYSVGINHLHRVGQYGNLRTNVAYYATSNHRTGSTCNAYGGVETLTLNESNKQHFKERTIVPQFHYQLNSPAVYLTDELTGSLSVEQNSNRLLSNGQPISERVVHHPLCVQNKLQFVLNAGNHVYSANSLTRYFRRSEVLNVEDAMQLYNAGQKVVLNRLFARNSIATSLNVLGNVMELEYRMEYCTDRLSTDYGPYNTVSYFTSALSPSYTISYYRGFVALACPAALFVSRVPWRSGSHGGAKVHIAPSLRWKHDFSPFWRSTVGCSLRSDNDNGLLSAHDVMTNYRTRTTLLDRYGWTRTSSIALSLNYSDLIRMFSWNLMASASSTTSDHHNAYSYRERYTVVSPVWEDTRSRMLIVQTTADKAMTGLGLAVKGSFNYTRHELPIEQNNLRETVKSNVITTALNLRWSKVSWLVLSLSPTANVAWQDKYSHGSSYALHSLFALASVSLFPVKALSLTASCEYSAMQIDATSYARNTFADAGITLSASRNVEIALQASNIFNRKQYVEAYFSGFDYRYYSVPLRHRELLLSVKFKL